MNELIDVADPGLDDEEAARRLRVEGPNELPAAAPRGLRRQIAEVLRQPMLGLLLGAGAVNFVLAEPLDGAVLLSFVLVVIGISVYQQRKTERALHALRDLSAPRALVRRSGRQLRVAGRELVVGDCILLAEGDRVPADAVLDDAVNLSVDESLLTGESVPVGKAARAAGDDGDVRAAPPGGDATPWLFSGTLVVRGHGAATVTATGTRSELGRIGLSLGEIGSSRTRLQVEIDRLVRLVAAVALAVASLIVVIHGLARGGWLEGVLAGIAVAMAMLPEEFPVVLTVFVALGAWRMSQHNVLTRRSPAIESLGSVTVVCVDKTGTITRNEMTVRQLIVDDVAHDAALRPLPEVVHTIAEFASLASPVEAFDPMDRAMRQLAGEALAGSEHEHADWELVREYPLSPELLALSHVWRSPGADRYVVAAKGAPEAVFDLCHLDPSVVAGQSEVVRVASEGGLRLLGVARAAFPAAVPLPVSPHDFVFDYLGLVALADPVRPGVAEAVAQCHEAGVRTVMITGDHPSTAMAVAAEVGLDLRGGFLDGPGLAALDDAELDLRVGTVDVFARMVPEQKLRLVRALQRRGEVVAMTGDGVNDAPALRAADIGVAMGGRGTDVAREAAALVVTDDDFTTIVRGIRSGRMIFDNLRTAMAYIVAVHVPVIGMALLPLLAAGWPLVLLPVQIAMLELIIDPACSVVFEAEAADPELMRRAPRRAGATLLDRRVLFVAVGQGLSVLVAVAVLYGWSVRAGRDAASVRAATFTALVLSNLALILVNRSWQVPAWRRRLVPNRTVRWVVGPALVLLAVVLTVPGARRPLALGAPAPVDLLLAVAVPVVSLCWFEGYKLWRERHRHLPRRPPDG